MEEVGVEDLRPVERPPARRWGSVYQPALLRVDRWVDRAGGREQRTLPTQGPVVEVCQWEGVPVE